MFRCQATGELSEPGEKQVRVTVMSRSKTYVNRTKNEEGRYEETVTQGSEIIKEIVVREKNRNLVEVQNEIHNIYYFYSGTIELR